VAIAAPCRGASLFGVIGYSQTIMELDPDTGVLRNSFDRPQTPVVNSVGGDALAYSGTDLYYSHISSTEIFRLDPATGAVRSSFAVPPTSFISGLGYGVTSYGPTLFAMALFRQIRLYHPISGELHTTLTLDFDFGGALDFNTATGTLYVGGPAGVVNEVDPTTGAVLNSFDAGARQWGLGFVGGRLFTGEVERVSPTDPATIEERDPRTGAVLRSFPSPLSFGSISGLAALDGTPVPEPTTQAMALCGALSLFLRWSKGDRASLVVPSAASACAM
jgi:hypothetical protein